MTTVIECRPPVAANPAPNLKAIKAKQQAAWSSGDYTVIGTSLQIVGEQLAEAMDLRAGQTVLDVAAGNGVSHSPPPGAGARSRPPIMSSRYSPAAASVPRRTGLRSNSKSPTPKTCRFKTRPLTQWFRLSARCSAPIRTAPLLK